MTATVAFYIGGGSMIDKFISWWTADFKDKLNGKWKLVPSHVEISFDKVSWWSASTRNGVFRKKIMQLNQDKWRLYSFEVSKEESDAMISRARSFLGMQYDWANIIFSDGLKLDIGARSKLTCDESVARILLLCWIGGGLNKINNLNPKRLEEYISNILKDIP